METVRLLGGIIILLVVFGLLPILLGSLITPWIHREDAKTVSFSYVTGVMEMLCLMQIFSVPMTLAKLPFSMLVMGYSAVLGILALLVLIFRRDVLKETFCRAAHTVKGAGKIWIVIVAVIFIPAVLLTFYTPYIYGDDKTYLTMVNDIVSSNTLYLVDTVTGEAQSWVAAKYALSSYWTFLAYLAKVTGIHPLILCKTLLPYLIIPTYYVVQGLFAAWLFRGQKRKIDVYMLIVALVSIFGGFSNYTITYRLMTWVWQSKAFLALIVMPFLFYFANQMFEKRTRVIEYVLLAISVMAACSTTLTGAGIAVAMVAVLAFIYAVRRRKFGILIGTGIACSPALVFMVMYLKYDLMVSAVNRFLF